MWYVKNGEHRVVFASEDKAEAKNVLQWYLDNSQGWHKVRYYIKNEVLPPNPITKGAVFYVRWRRNSDQWYIEPRPFDEADECIHVLNHISETFLTYETTLWALDAADARERFMGLVQEFDDGWEV